MLFVGTWLSLVEHRVRDAGAAGSNPVVPTSNIKCVGALKWKVPLKIRLLAVVNVKSLIILGCYSIGDSAAALSPATRPDEKHSPRLPPNSYK